MLHFFESSMSLAKLSAIRQMLLNKSGLVRSVSICSLSLRRVGDYVWHMSVHLVWSHIWSMKSFQCVLEKGLCIYSSC